MAKEAMAMSKNAMQATQRIKIAEKSTSVYHRMMRYPCFPAKPTKKIVHPTNDNGTFIVLTNDATVEDFEKLMCLVYLTQQGKAEEVDAKIVAEKADEDDEEDNRLVIVKTSLYQLWKISKAHDYKHIVQALVKMSGVLMISDFVDPKTGKHAKRYVRPLFKVEVSEDKQLKVYMFRRFLDLCKNTLSLTFDLEKLLRLPKLAKNLYLFLYANYDKKEFNIDTIAERTLLKIDAPEDKYLIQSIRRAFDALKKEKIIYDYQIDKKNRKVKVHFSKKQAFKEEKL